MSEFKHPSLRASTSKNYRINIRRRIFLACFASVLPLFPLAFPAPTDIHIASGSPCYTVPIADPRGFTTGRTWINEQSCKWLGLACNPAASVPRSHFPIDDASEDDGEEKDPISCIPSATHGNYSEFWHSGNVDPDSWDDDERTRRTIPQFVLDYAPLIHLYSKEQFWPGDIASHLLHTTPYMNFTPIDVPDKEDRHWNLTELERLKHWGRYGRDVFLTSDDNVEDRPEWLGGKINIPDDDDEDSNPFKKHWGLNDEDKVLKLPDLDDEVDDPEELDRGTQEELDREAEQIASELRKRSLLGTPFTGDHGGRSDAPVILIVAPKPNGIIDAFWFFFYSYNLGNTVFNVRFGNHVGDWEHTVLRFQDGEPIEVFFSEHYFGEAYSYSAVEKIGKRPLGFSATGTHAMYGTAGVHRYILPYGLLSDHTDRGPLWDPVLNSHSYIYETATNTILSSTMDPYAPTEWLNFPGHWGDKAYPLSDHRQYKFAGQYHYVSGPLGPKYHRLGREKICQGGKECKIKHWLTPPLGGMPKYKYGSGEDAYGNKEYLIDDIQIMLANRFN